MNMYAIKCNFKILVVVLCFFAVAIAVLRKETTSRAAGVVIYVNSVSSEEMVVNNIAVKQENFSSFFGELLSNFSPHEIDLVLSPNMNNEFGNLETMFFRFSSLYSITKAAVNHDADLYPIIHFGMLMSDFTQTKNFFIDHDRTLYKFDYFDHYQSSFVGLAEIQKNELASILTEDVQAVIAVSRKLRFSVVLQHLKEFKILGVNDVHIFKDH